MTSRFSFCLTFFFMMVLSLSAQTTANLQFSAFVDMYYAYDLNQPPNRERSFTTQPLRHNEVNINLAVLSAQYTQNNVRARLALQTGTYVQSNYIAEPQDLRIIHEASAGVRLGKDVWIDMGIMPSHIGVESAISKDNWNYSRSFVADYSPYYEAGIKLSAEVAENLTASILLLNGWQNIRETNNSKAIGTQLQWRPTTSTLLNWSTFIGNEQPDTALQKMRYFNNVFVQHSFSERVEMSTTLDVGVQSATKGGSDLWWGTSFLLRYHWSENIKLGSRVEYYSDPNGVIIPLEQSMFRTVGASINIDYYPAHNMLLRAEGRIFRASDAIFPTTTTPSRYNGFIVMSCAVWL